MTIKQLSVFLENKTGRINDVTRILGKHGINMHAFSMAETTDFGILRLIVSEVDKAVEILRDLSLLQVPGTATKVPKHLAPLSVPRLTLRASSLSSLRSACPVFSSTMTTQCPI